MGFTKKVENFVCEHCGTAVVGSGYTNHCPKCLWSKHVDVHPGDREANCGGLMEPKMLEGSSPNYYLTHVCSRCGFKRRNGVVDSDDIRAVLALATKQANTP